MITYQLWPTEAKAGSVRALSVIDSHFLVERMDVLEGADSFIREEVWETSGSHMWEENTEQEEPLRAIWPSLPLTVSLGELHSVYTAGHNDSRVLF